MSRRDEERLRLPGLWRVYRVFGRHYRPYTRVLLGAGLALLGTVAMEAMVPWPLKLILDHVVLGRHLPHRFQFLAAWVGGDRLLLLLVLSLSIVVVAALAALFSYINKFWVSGTGDRITADIRDRVFAHLQRLSLSFHDSARSGDLVYRLTSDTKAMKNLLIDFPQDFTMRVFSMVLYGGLMLVLDWRLGLIALAALPLIYLLVRGFGEGMRGATREARLREGEVASIVSENLRNIEVIQAYGQEQTEQRRLAAGSRQSLEAQLRAVRVHRTFGRLVDLLVASSTAGVLFVGGRRAFAGEILPGTLVLFLAYIQNFYGSFDKFSTLFMGLARSQVCGERLVELVESDMVAEDAPDAVAALPLQGRIEFRDVSFSYGRGEPALKNASFVALPGETVAIVGTSGAGKSTLISLLLRFYDPQQGAILVDGVDVRRYTRASLREQITVVLQSARLLRRSVADNIGFGRRGATRAEIEAAAREAEAHEFVLRMPNAYDAVLAEAGDDLSGGERQRIHIARAMLRRTPIVILDEPSASLDADAESAIRAALMRLTRGRTTFIIAHRMATLAHADRILLLEGGAITGQGTHAELLARSHTYREFCGLDRGVPPERNGVASLSVAAAHADGGRP